ncbi:MAG: carboxypeptidase-like regulatory domain-containing protein, partial [Tannerella sp.]|nr:carboxypeptidase-like regulatory domain-containing protein [Tannerella sp.]
MTNTLIDGMKNAKLKKLVNSMTLFAFLLIMGAWTASADSQESLERQQDKAGVNQSRKRVRGMIKDEFGEIVAGAAVTVEGSTRGVTTDN